MFLAAMLCAWPLRAADVELEACAAIESAVERLDCYDRIARGNARESGPAEPRSAEPKAAEPSLAEPSPDESGPAAESPALAVPDKVPATPVPTNSGRAAAGVDSDEGERWFGRDQERAAEGAIDAIEARIESVRKAPLGQQIMTLSNGQVWMETEPGRRRIAPGQVVVIQRRLLHFEMNLRSQPDVTVRRID